MIYTYVGNMYGARTVSQKYLTSKQFRFSYCRDVFYFYIYFYFIITIFLFLLPLFFLFYVLLILFNLCIYLNKQKKIDLNFGT